MFEGDDLANFWEDSEYALESYTSPPPSDELIASIEAELGVRLPPSYVALMKTRNGGIPRNRCYPTREPTSWSADHVAISGIMGIGRDKRYSLCGGLGSRFMQDEWGYPDIGICICNCPSAGHDMIMLDYRKCGPDGEPVLVHVDQERDYRITFLARDFETFVRGLVHESVYDTSAEDLQADLKKIDAGAFSTQLAELVEAADEADFGQVLREVCRELTNVKGYFALHDDERSYLVYDILFYLYSASNDVGTKGDYLAAYPDMLAFGNGEFSTGGYAPDFVDEWFTHRLSSGSIVTMPTGKLGFSLEFRPSFLQRIGKYTSSGDE
jgi:hypothetical protein